MPREKNRVLIAHNARVVAASFMNQIFEAGVVHAMTNEQLLDAFFEYMAYRGFTTEQAERAAREVSVRAPSSAAELSLIRCHS